ncbi:hypothetical protein HaLaN_15456 [Haematococcus lacustris]|uniref:ANK_REP_REGION domain-containing protein n=1 Tax=Haematococcus lacustris TaxID=44745 RepID=A0A699Z8W2_HAELA|nr:hypothetical protein HaLaN_15456 [Haematococcus lacustris]
MPMGLFDSFKAPNKDILKAIEAGNLKDLQLALQGGAARLNEGNSRGETPLHIAAGHPRHSDSSQERNGCSLQSGGG